MKWWHISDFEFSQIVKSLTDHISEYNGNGNVYGPFDTFIDAKIDAIEYHQATLETARRLIKEIRSMRKTDCEKEIYEE